VRRLYNAFSLQVSGVSSGQTVSGLHRTRKELKINDANSVVTMKLWNDLSGTACSVGQYFLIRNIITD